MRSAYGKFRRTPILGLIMEDEHGIDIAVWSHNTPAEARALDRERRRRRREARGRGRKGRERRRSHIQTRRRRDRGWAWQASVMLGNQIRKLADQIRDSAAPALAAAEAELDRVLRSDAPLRDIAAESLRAQIRRLSAVLGLQVSGGGDTLAEDGSVIALIE